MRPAFCTAVLGILILHSGLCAATADTIVSDAVPSGAPSASPPAGYSDGDFLYQHYVPQAGDPQQNGLYYRLFLPRNYATSGTYLHPLVIFHHGDGEKENAYPPRNQKQLSNNGQYNFCSVANQAEFPCFVAMVQAGWWGRDASGQQTGPGLVAALARQYRIDPRWVIVTGLSGGGGATLSWAGQRPDVYAGYVALSAPSPGDAGSYQPMRLATIPGWFFGSRNDSIDVNPSTVRDIRMFGGNPALTVYNSGGHSYTTWNAAYSTPALYQWLKSLQPGQTPRLPVEVGFTAPAASGPYTTTSATVTPAGTTVDNRIDGSSAGVSAVSWYTAADAPGLDGETALGASAATGTTTWTASGSRAIPPGDTAIVATGTGASLHPTQAGFTYYSRTLAIHRDGAAAQELDVALGGRALPDGYRVSVASGAAGSATQLSFVLGNSGGTALTVAPSVAITYPANANCTATVTTAPPATIAGGATASLVISVTPTATGMWEFRLALASDDADEATYNLSISGNAGLATGPEIGLSRGGTIGDGGTDSVAGSAPGVATTLTYVVANSGSGALTITTPVTISGTGNCTATVTTQPSTAVAAGDSTGLVVSVTPTAAGPWSFTVSAANTDADESPYDWTVSGTATSPVPELDIARGATAIADGGSDAVAGGAAGAAMALSYTMRNSGSATLGVTTPVAISGASNCTAMVTTQPGASIAAGASSTLAVSVTPSAAGAWSFAVSVANTDADEDPYDWTVSGMAGAIAAPELDISRNGALADGGSDVIPVSHFGTMETVTYTLTNSGGATLGVTTPVTIGGVSNCTASVVTQPSASIAAGGMSSLVVSVTPTATGAWSFTVAVANTDANEGIYDWTVGGSATISGVDGGTDSPSSDGGGGCGAGSTIGLLLAGAACMLRRRRGSVS